MAYCPKCDKIVEDKWLECPVCRTDLVQRDELLRRDAARRAAPASFQPPQRQQFRQQSRVGRTDFLDRITGVLAFREDILKDISIVKPINEIVLLYLLSLIISVSIQPAQSYSKYMGQSLETSMAPQPGTSSGIIMFALIVTAVGLVIYLIGVAITHFILKMFNGRGDFMATLTTMLYISTVWGLIQTILSVIPLLTGSSAMLILSALISFTLSLITLVEYVIGLSVAHEVEKVKSAIAVIISWAVQFTISMLLVIAVVGFLTIALLGTKGAVPVH